MLTKSPRYFWDAEAVRKPLALDTMPRYSRGMNENKWTNGAGNAASLNRPERFELPAEKPHTLHQPRTNRKYDGTDTASNGTNIQNHAGNSLSDPAGRNRRTSDAFVESLDELIDETRTYLAHLERVKQGNAPMLDEAGNLLALYYSTQSFRDAHFATFSERMITPLVLGSTSERGVCPRCGAPWTRVTKREARAYRESGDGANDGANNKVPYSQNNPHRERLRQHKNIDVPIRGTQTMHAHRAETGNDDYWKAGRVTTDWRPTCACIKERAPQQAMRGDDLLELVDEVAQEFCPIPATILDPFSGAGTTQLVALKNGRNAIYIDLKPEYAEMARKRIAPILESRQAERKAQAQLELA